MCIACGNCSAYCEMGIDVRAYAMANEDVKRAACVGCGMCAHVCPRGVLRLLCVSLALTTIVATYARRKKACPAPEPFPTDSANLTRFIPGTALALGDGVGKLERNEPRFRL